MTQEEEINVLVTAVGGELGISVLKALSIAELNLNLYGSDIFRDVAGDQWCKERFKVPVAHDKDVYLDAIRTIVETHRIDVIIPTADAEFPIYASLESDELKCKVLVQPEDEWNRFADKWKAYLWFAEHGIGTPTTRLPADIQFRDLFYPVIVKPRFGGGSRYIVMAEDKKELKEALKTVPQPIVQNLILPNDQEYTAGVFRWNDNTVDVIVMRRELKFGMTNKAWTVDRQDLEAFCRDTILKTNLWGSNNIQFRVDNEGPKVLEINHRFSGTTGIRANFGFNDAEMWIRDALGLPKLKPEIRPGKVLRYMEEIYTYD